MQRHDRALEAKFVEFELKVQLAVKVVSAVCFLLFQKYLARRRLCVCVCRLSACVHAAPLPGAFCRGS
jgi:hypothetical protein